MRDYITGKKILITGAASGLGKLLIEKFIKSDCTVIAVDRNELGLSNLVQELGDDRIRTFRCDLSVMSDIEALCASVKAEFEYIDILINNAGIVNGKYAHELSNQEIFNNHMINTIAPSILAKEFLPKMYDRNAGHIVSLCSASSFVGVPKLSDYAASKAAIYSLDESLRLEIKKREARIATTAICPFYIHTGMFDGVKTRFPSLLPILKPQAVVDRMYLAICRRERRLIMPWFVYSTLIIKILPPRVFDSILGFFGVNSSMDDFRGR